MGNQWFERRLECPGCASPRFRTIFEAPYDSPAIRDYLVEFYSPQGGVEFEYLDQVDYHLCECDACHLIFQRDIPNSVLMDRLYSQWIDPDEAFRRHQAQSSLAYYVSHAQDVMSICSFLGGDPSSLTVMDFGMGWGTWALMAKAFGCDSWGTELDAERARHAQSNGITVVAFEDIPERHFDFINTDQVFEHIAEPLETLRHLRRALKPGGIIKVSVPDAHDIDRRLRVMDWAAPKGLRNSLNLVAPLEHVNCFRRESLTRMAAAARMEEVFPSLRHQYRYVADRSSVRQMAKSVVRPIYRNLLKRGGYVLLRGLPDGNN